MSADTQFEDLIVSMGGKHLWRTNVTASPLYDVIYELTNVYNTTYIDESQATPLVGNNTAAAFYCPSSSGVIVQKSADMNLAGSDFQTQFGVGCFFKRDGAPGSDASLWAFGVNSPNNAGAYLRISATDIAVVVPGFANCVLATHAVTNYCDNAWHLCYVQFDPANSTADDRVKFSFDGAALARASGLSSISFSGTPATRGMWFYTDINYSGGRAGVGNYLADPFVIGGTVSDSELLYLYKKTLVDGFPSNNKPSMTPGMGMGMGIG